MERLYKIAQQPRDNRVLRTAECLTPLLSSKSINCTDPPKKKELYRSDAQLLLNHHLNSGTLGNNSQHFVTYSDGLLMLKESGDVSTVQGISLYTLQSQNACGFWLLSC